MYPLVLAMTLIAAAPVPLGVWGGTQIVVTFAGNGARIDTGCGAGTIGPLALAGDGSYTAPGVFDDYAPGPQRADAPPGGRPAAYALRIDGAAMALTIAVAGAAPRHFTLAHGRRVKLIRCL